MTDVSTYELVRRDLLHREQEETRLYGSPRVNFSGPEAILDAYEQATDLVVSLRQIIEEMTVQ